MIEQPAPSAPPSLRAGDEIGKFHGAKAATGADRLAQRHPPEAGLAGNELAVGTAAFVRVPLDEASTPRDLGDHLADRLAMLHGDDRRHRLRALAQQPGRPHEDVAATLGRHRAPDRKAARRRFEGPVEIGDRRVRDRA